MDGRQNRRESENEGAREWVTDRNAKKRRRIRMKHESTSYSVLVRLRRSRTSCEFQTSRTFAVVVAFFSFSPLLFRFSFSFLVDLLRNWTWKGWCGAGDKQNDASSRSSWEGEDDGKTGRREEERKLTKFEKKKKKNEEGGGEAAQCMRMGDGIESNRRNRREWIERMETGIWRWKGDATEAKDEKMQRRLLIAAAAGETITITGTSSQCAISQWTVLLQSPTSIMHPYTRTQISVYPSTLN